MKLVCLCILTILTSLIWGISLLPTLCILPYPILGAIPIGRGIMGVWAGAIGGYCQWLLLRQRIAIQAKHWVWGNAIGLGVGFVIGHFVSGGEPSVDWASYGWEGNLGWDIYFAKVFAMAGFILGATQWFVLRNKVKYTGWISIITATGGFAAGAFEGNWTDSVIQGFGHTTNDLGERMVGATFVGFPLALVILGLAMAIALVIILLQAEFQKVNTCSK